MRITARSSDATRPGAVRSRHWPTRRLTSDLVASASSGVTGPATRVPSQNVPNSYSERSRSTSRANASIISSGMGFIARPLYRAAVKARKAKTGFGTTER